MNDFREMVRADLAARLKATVKRRRPKPKGTLQRAAITAEVLPMFQEEARKRQGSHGAAPGRPARNTLDQKTQSVSATVTRARDEAAAMMNVSPGIGRAGSPLPSDARHVRGLLQRAVGDEQDSGEPTSQRSARHRELGTNWCQSTRHRIPGAPAHQAGAGSAAAGVGEPNTGATEMMNKQLGA